MLSLAIFVLLQVSDALLTAAILRRGGRECNPVLDHLIRARGLITTLVGSKLIVVALGTWLYFEVPALLIALDVLFVAVVANNVVQWRKRRRLARGDSV